MNREETLRRYINNQASKNYEDLGFILIGDIYDDFESRLCKNCKWFKGIDKSYKVCKLYDISHGEDFGCNKFERIKT